jgi:tripartite-type tricarboxylate transporter receptor subunit TctC
MKFARRTLLTGAAGDLALAALGARAQALPDTVKILAGFAAGGTVDVTARRLADKLRDVIAKSMVVENRTGAGGQIALSALKTAAPDGLTLLVTPMSMLGIYPHTYKKLPYDPAADFLPVSQAVRFDFGFAVGPQVPATVRTLGEFVAWCKANPGNANFGSPAAGSVPHFVAELFGRSAGIGLKHVPYRGTQPAIVDLMGGQVASVSGPVGEFLQHLPSGKVRLLATSGAARNRFTSSVPTYAEQGFKDIVFDEWFGIYVPAKTPAAVVSRLSDALRKALTSPDVVEALGQMGLEAAPSTPEQLAALLKRDTERWAPLIKTIGFSAES